MTPTDHAVHDFIYDLNRHITFCVELAGRDEPTPGTDEHEKYLEAITEAEHERADLEKRLSALLWLG